MNGQSGGKAALWKRTFQPEPAVDNICDIFSKDYRGGAEIELSLLFADMRESMQSSESMKTPEYSQLINRFYNTVAKVKVESDALIDKIIGDQVAGMYASDVAMIGKSPNMKVFLFSNEAAGVILASEAVAGQLIRDPISVRPFP